jgi:hypothetical protein
VSEEDFDEAGRQLAAMLRRAGRDPADILQFVDPVPLVHVRCACCGDVTGTIEGRERGGQVGVRVGRHRYSSLDVLVCPEHGQLDVAASALTAYIEQARQTRRPVRYVASPRSTP